MWSPSYCRQMTFLFDYQQCQNNLGFIQVMGTIVLIGHVFLQARVWLILRKVYKHGEMNESVKKQANPNKTSVMLV